MRIRLKGINRATMRLADGHVVTYYYAWKGGPRLVGKPGSPEFVDSYNEAIATRRQPRASVLLAITKAFQQSQDFLRLAERTRADYRAKMALIEKKFGEFPLGAMTDRRARGIFLAWRDELAKSSRRQADYAWTVLALILAWALGRGLIAANPCEKGGRLYRNSRADRVWTTDDEKRFLDKAPAHLHSALLLALWTGQRQGDLLKLPWSAYDGTHIRLRHPRPAVVSSSPSASPSRRLLIIRQQTAH